VFAVTSDILFPAFSRTLKGLTGLNSIIESIQQWFEVLLDSIRTWLETWGYLVIFAMTFLENSAFMGLIAPGEWTLVVAGLLASEGTLELPWLYAAAITGAVLGDITGYIIGRTGGYRFFLRYGHYFRFKESYLDTTKEYFRKHGGKTVFVGRFVPFVKVFAPMSAGIGRMPVARFIAWDAPGAIIASSLLITGGYLFGESWQRINQYIGWAAGLIFAVIIISAASAVAVRRRRRLE
jgi:undecaprenyl-diphosphatase